MTPNLAHEVLDVLRSPGSLVRWEKELNVYILEVDFEVGEVRLDDDLDTSCDGTTVMSVEETVDLLEDYLARHNL